MKKCKKLIASTKFNLKTAKRLVDNSYYTAQNKNMRDNNIIEKDKISLKTPKWEYISELLNFFRESAENNTSTSAKILNGIYMKNVNGSSKNLLVENYKILSVVSRPEILAIAYRAIRGNKGALTLASWKSKEDFNTMTKEQQEFYLQSFNFPDGINLLTFFQISDLLRKGLYPWGTSKRIYVDKPGQAGKSRPITIPPFTDKIVQKAISLVLEAIYEPVFEKMNRSFGFRPNYGCHDALVALTSKYTNGMRTAVEGDIKAAYDNCNKQTLITLLNKRIKDRKFIKLMEERLDYDFVENSPEGDIRIKPTKGVPQGGIDSPYLFNIYMHELDIFVHTDIQNEIDKLNQQYLKKNNTPIRIINKAFNSNRRKEIRLIRRIGKVKAELNKLPKDSQDDRVLSSRKKLFDLIKAVRLNEHQKNMMSSSTENTKQLRIFYVRYADDWIILTNGSKEIGNRIKIMIADFLNKTLDLNLSEEKTLVTDITKEPANFLGFELKISKRGALTRKAVNGCYTIKKFNLYKKAGLLLWVQPDRKRLINRFHLKGFCDKEGFPISLTWLSGLEANVIIERFNATMRGLAEYYLPIIRNKSKIHRWIYILRFACLKTLAQKYKCTISKLFKKFGCDMHSKSDQTIKIRVIQKFQDKDHSKDWKLLTYKDLIKLINPIQKRKLEKNFWDRERGLTVSIPTKKGRIAKITNDNYLEKITWVSWRTSATFNMPCAYCGTDENIHQHHIKHIRKRAYSSIPDSQSYKRIMALRNRKQIPLCETCHCKLVHTGKYDGPKLTNLAPNIKLVDNRIIHIESFIKPGSEYNSKTLAEKGWTIC